MEIEELKQEIRDEKDRVVVDIESPDSKVFLIFIWALKH